MMSAECAASVAAAAAAWLHPLLRPPNSQLGAATQASTARLGACAAAAHFAATYLAAIAQSPVLALSPPAPPPVLQAVLAASGLLGGDRGSSDGGDSGGGDATAGLHTPVTALLAALPGAFPGSSQATVPSALAANETVAAAAAAEALDGIVSLARADAATQPGERAAAPRAAALAAAVGAAADPLVNSSRALILYIVLGV